MSQLRVTTHCNCLWLPVPIFLPLGIVTSVTLAQLACGFLELSENREGWWIVGETEEWRWNSHDPGSLSIVPGLLSFFRPPWPLWKVRLRAQTLGAPPGTALCTAPSSPEQALPGKSAAALRCGNSVEHPFRICVCGKIIKGSGPLYLRMYFPTIVYKYSMCR